MQAINVNMLWVHGPLSGLEYACLSSFVRQGYRVVLWTYGTTHNVPHNVEIQDAREVLPENTIFLNRQGSYAGFSDLFRYAVLRKCGGLYSDVDVVAIKPATMLPKTSFLVSERMRDGRTKINGNLIYVPIPSNGDIVDLAYAYANVFPKKDVIWSEIGPSLLTAIVGIYPHHGFKIMPPTFANEINWWDCPARLLSDEQVPDCHFLHLYNEMWRKANRDKNSPIDRHSLLGRALHL
jgi:hypothetical protein